MAERWAIRHGPATELEIARRVLVRSARGLHYTVEAYKREDDQLSHVAYGSGASRK